MANLPATTAARSPIFERAIAAVAPSWAAARSEARMRTTRAWLAEEVMREAARNYDANAHSRRTGNWLPTGASGSAITNGLDRLRARSRDLARNNEWMKKGLGVIRDGVVGPGFAVKWTHRDEGVARDLKDLWAAWADGVTCDAGGLENFDAMLGSLVAAMAEGGDVFVRRRWRLPEDQLAVPVQLQMLEAEHLDTDRNETGNAGARIVQGVEFDPIGRRVAYWLFRDHPGDNWPTTRQSVRVPAADVVHLFRIERPGAVRGIPWGAPCLLRLRDMAEWEDAMLLRTKLANMFVGVVRLAQDAPPLAPVPGVDGRVYEPIDEWKPGMHQYLGPGEEMQWNDPPQPGNDAAVYLRIGQMAVAAGLEIPYESLTGDLKNTSFASGRLGYLQWSARIETYRWQMLVPRACMPLARYFQEAVAITNPRALEARPVFDPPRREWIDPVQEVNAAEKAVRAGFTSRQAVCRSMGEDPERVTADHAADAEEQRTKGIVFTTSPVHDLNRQPTAPAGRRPGEAANAPR